MVCRRKLFELGLIPHTVNVLNIVFVMYVEEETPQLRVGFTASAGQMSPRDETDPEQWWRSFQEPIKGHFHCEHVL